MIYFLIYCIFGTACVLLVGALIRRKFMDSSYSRFTMPRSSDDNVILYSTLYVGNPSSSTIDTSNTTHHHSIDCGSHHAGSFDCGGGNGHH